MAEDTFDSLAAKRDDETRVEQLLAAQGRRYIFPRFGNPHEPEIESVNNERTIKGLTLNRLDDEVHGLLRAFRTLAMFSVHRESIVELSRLVRDGIPSEELVDDPNDVDTQNELSFLITRFNDLAWECRDLIGRVIHMSSVVSTELHSGGINISGHSASSYCGFSAWMATRFVDSAKLLFPAKKDGYIPGLNYEKWWLMLKAWGAALDELHPAYATDPNGFIEWLRMACQNEILFARNKLEYPSQNPPLNVQPFFSEKWGSDPDVKEVSAPTKTRKRNRRGSLETKIKPLTERQVEAVRLYAELGSDMTKVGKAMGISRQAAQYHYDAANKKLGVFATKKPKTRQIRDDHLGDGVQVDAASK